MYNLLLSIQILSVIVLFAEAVYIFRKMTTEIHRFLFLNCVATFMNSIGYLIEMVSRSEKEYLRGIQVSYIGKVWIVYSIFLFLMLVCHKKVNRYLRVILAVFHTFTFVLVATCEWNTLYYKSRVYLTDGQLFPNIKSENGIAHYLYDAVIFIYIIIGIYNLVRYVCQTENTVNRRRLCWILAAVVTDASGYLVHFFIDGKGYDCTNLGFAIGTVFMGIAIFKYKLMDTLQLVKDYVVDELSEAIIAVNDAGTTDYTNSAADRIIASLGNDEKGAIEIIRQHIAEHSPIDIDGRTYSPEEILIEDTEAAQGKIYVLVDETEHFRYLREVSEQKEIAEQANASKSRFLSVVSHEIRTPMNAVVSMTELLLKAPEKLDETQLMYLRNMKTSGESLVMIVNDILDQSKIEAGKMELVEAPYELRPMVEDVKLIIENRLGTKNIELISSISDVVPDVLVGDGLRIRQILINLMNNAVKFTEKGFIKLTITLSEQLEGKNLIRFAISDSGQGIKAEDLEKLGQAFTQVDTRKNHGKEGTGLGLSISRDFIAMMGGSLKVKSEYGRGSEFYFEIPQGIPEKDTVPSGNCKGASSQSIPDLSGKKVLVVDDSEINLMIAEALLSEIKLEADTATSGTKAIGMIKENRYDAVFMDYIMPQMDGIETTSRIRQLSSECRESDKEAFQYFENVPIIALTADDSKETREQFQNAGITGFTDKPIDVSKITKWLL